jgi:DNA polymerase
LPAVDAEVDPAVDPAGARPLAARQASESLGAWAAVTQAPVAADPGEVGAHGLRRIRDDLGDCQRCALGQSRRHIVFGVGSPEADLVVVGEAPGYQEDQVGEPFVGPAGQMLDRMLRNVLQLERAQVHIVNVVKCRPPDNRKPLPQEVGACLPFLHRQILAIQPRVLLVLGNVALHNLFDTTEGITRTRGVWREWRGIPTMPTFHPAYLLRNAADKRKTFEDLKQLRERYDALGGRR